MFIGHFAAGFAAKRIDSHPSLATYFLAAQLPDVLWPMFVLAGWEHVTVVPGDTAVTPLRFDSYPYSHSLLGAVGWGALLGLLYALWRRNPRGAVLVALLSISHWLLDFVSHRADMPLLISGGPRLGLGLWNSVPATLVVEGLLFGAGVWLYLRASAAVSRGRVAALVMLLGALYLGNVFGPPPPSATAVAATVLIGAPLFAAFAWWVDRPAPRAEI